MYTGPSARHLSSAADMIQNGMSRPPYAIDGAEDKPQGSSQGLDHVSPSGSTYLLKHFF